VVCQLDTTEVAVQYILLLEHDAGADAPDVWNPCEFVAGETLDGLGVAHENP
jgi:hypothetical protein